MAEHRLLLLLERPYSHQHDGVNQSPHIKAEHPAPSTIQAHDLEGKATVFRSFPSCMGAQEQMEIRMSISKAMVGITWKSKAKESG